MEAEKETKFGTKVS